MFSVRKKTQHAIVKLAGRHIEIFFSLSLSLSALTHLQLTAVKVKALWRIGGVGAARGLGVWGWGQYSALMA